jgi:hypothetical protein
VRGIRCWKRCLLKEVSDFDGEGDLCELVEIAGHKMESDWE